MGKFKADSMGTKVTIFLAGFALMADMAIYPAAESMFNDFPNASVPLLNFVLTGTSLMIIFASIVCGILAQFISKKLILIASYTVFLISAFATGYLDSASSMAVMRAITGISMGFIGTIMISIISQIYINEKTRSAVLGVYNGIMAALGAIISFIAGYLAVNDWHLIFTIYLFAIPIIILSYIFIPSTPPVKEEVQGDTEPNAVFPMGRVLATTFAAFVINAIYAVILTMVSVYLAEQQIGDASTAGIMGSVGTLGSFLAGMTFVFFYDRFKYFMPVIFSLFMAIGYAIMSVSMNTVVIGLMCVLLGCCYGMSYSYYLMHSSVIVSPSKASLSIGFATAGIYVGLFSGPYVPMAYQYIFDLSTIAQTMPYLAGTSLIFCIVATYIALRNRQKDAAAATAAH